MDTSPSFQTDALIAEDIDAYLDQHQHKSPIDHRLPAAEPDHTGAGRLRPAVVDPAGRRPEEPGAMIGRIVWFAALALIAVLVSLLQIDKQSEKSSQLATLVPGPMRNHAQVVVTASALGGKDAARGLAEAQRLVRRRPIPAEYLALLAAGQAKAGQNEAALQTIQIAGKRGWREPTTQVAVLRIALAAGDEAEAARRYAALFLRTATPDALLAELGPEVLDAPGGAGQQALTKIVVGGERWHSLFLRRGSPVMPPAAFAAITTASLRQDTTFECGQLAQAIKILTRRDRAAGDALARAAGEGACPQLAPKPGPAL
jgi:hypothetical protein